VTRAIPLGRSRRVRRASIAFAVLIGTAVSGLGALPAHASEPLTFDHVAGLPRHITPESVALDASGDVYVTESSSSSSTTGDRVTKYSSDGLFLDVLAGPGVSPAGGPKNGFVANPNSVAIAPSGDIYVLENGYGAGTNATNEVSRYDSLGNFLGAWGAFGTGNGQFKTPAGIAVDSVGNVYVADQGNHRVQKFASDGSWVATWDFTSNGIDPYSTAGLTFDANDVAWVVGSNRVARYSTAGVLQNSFSVSGATAAVVDAKGNAWISVSGNSVKQYDASGNLLATLGSGEVSTPKGLALNASGDTLYVADTGHGRIAKYTIPTVDTSWTSAGVHGVTLDGSVVYGSGGGNVRTYSTAGVAGTSWASTGASGIAPDGAGNTWVVSTGDGVVNEYDASGSLLTTIGATQLSSPQGVAYAGGKVFVADTGNGRIVRYATDGTLETSWLVTGGVVTDVAVSGSTVYAAAGNNVRAYTTAGVVGSNWGSTGATGIAVDASGNVWVTSSAGVVRKYSSAGVFSLALGSGRLSAPQGVFVTAAGKVYVADTGNDRIIRFSPTIAFQLEWGEYPGAGVEDTPTGLATDAAGNVYVTNKAQDLIQKFDVDGNFLTEFGGSGAAAGKLNNPAGIAISPGGDVYVADTANQRIQKFDATGAFLTQWGSFGTANGMFDTPSGIAIDAAGNVYVADTGNNRIQKFGAGGAFVTAWGGLGTGDGQFKSPHGVEIDGSGNVWVADTTNQRIQEFDAGGAFLSKWGSGPSGQDGRLSSPYDLAFDADGTIWVADRNNYRIQRFTTAGAFLSKLGAQGLRTAEFDLPSGIAIDTAGNVLVADTNNQRVQVFVDANGPDVTFSSGPSTVSSSTTATFGFSANEPGATFECKLDAGSYASCASGATFNSIPEGAHTLAVRATDVLANVGNPATYGWSVDLTPPTVSIDSSPSSPTASTSASFSYHSSEANSTFLCSLDGALPPASCGASYSHTVTNGDHTFDVWAIDQAGNQSGSAATFAWTVDTTPPVVHIDSGPSGFIKSTTASFTFSSPDVGATFECHLDGAGYTPCTSAKNYNGLTAGQHVFYVRGTDALGNKSADKTQTWTVDLADHKPDGQIATGTTYVGNGVYNNTGKSQTKTLKTKAGTTVSFKIKIENDGTDTDSYTVVGAGSVKGYAVSYYVGATDYTTKIVNGTYVFSVAPGAYKSITMKVKVGATGKASFSSLIKATSGHDSSKVDAVKGTIKRV